MMKCPSCSAECSDQSAICDFCGYALVPGSVQTTAQVPPSPPPPPTEAPAVEPYQPATPASRPGEPVPNHMVWAIVSTVIATLVTMLACCCLPLGLPSGIAAIVFASRVNKHFEVGDITGALQASKTAKLWCWVTTALAILFGILLIVSFALNGMEMMDPAFLENLSKQIEAGR